jgi:hypothetical protein
MENRTRTAIGDCDGFAIVTPIGRTGWIEETWLGHRGEPSAFAVRLADGRRGLLLRSDVESVDPHKRTIVVRPGSRLLELEPPHLESGPAGDGSATATWTTTGGSLAVPGLTEPRPGPPAEPSIIRPVAVLYAAVTAIVIALIGLVVLVAYVVTGSTHF